MFLFFLGYGGLSLSIEGPSKAEIACKDNEDGTLNIGYKPTEPGYYIVNLKFADHHVDGSPFTVKVCEGRKRIFLPWPLCQLFNRKGVGLVSRVK